MQTTINDLPKKNIPPNQICAEELFVPNGNKVNSNRGVMFAAHIPQIPVLKKPEIPLVFSRFENQIGNYSAIGYDESDDDYEVVKKLVRNKYNYTLLLKSKTTGKYTIKDRTEVFWITEKYGYRYNNYLDELDEGDIIEKGDILIANTSYDEYMNLAYGANLRAMYYSDRDWTHEDAIVLAESARSKFSYYSIIKPELNINTNDILLNIYGDKNNYKCFPEIGEDIVDKILLILRRNSYDTMITNLANLNEYQLGDTPIYVSGGKVVDIRVYCNNNIEKLRNIPYYNQLIKYVDIDRKYFQEVIDTLKPLITKKFDKCSDELIVLYNDCCSRMDEKNYYEFNGNVFDNIRVEFTIMKESKVNRGMKLTGRYG